MNSRNITILIFLFFLQKDAFPQLKDSVLFYIVKAGSQIENYDQFDLSIYNYSANPVSILHSCYLNLIPIAEQKLARRKMEGDTAVYSFLYSARDDLNVYETLYNDNHDGELVLPFQKLDLHVLIPADSSNKRVLEVELVVIPDLCYATYKRETFTQTTEWYKKYKREAYRVKL